MVAKPVHVSSGVAVFPVRTATLTVVPSGDRAAHWMASQSTTAEASYTRDRNVPLVA